MKKDVQKFCEHCIVCKKAKSKVKPHGLYTPLSIPEYPWIDLSIDFVPSFPPSLIVVLYSYSTNSSMLLLRVLSTTIKLPLDNDSGSP